MNQVHVIRILRQAVAETDPEKQQALLRSLKLDGADRVIAETLGEQYLSMLAKPDRS